MTGIFPTRLSALRLTNFRNYPDLSLSIEPRLAVFTGLNGAGKTNLLEAISFLSPGRGLRRAQYLDVALASEKGGDGLWAVSTSLETGFGEVNIGTGLTHLEGSVEKNRKIRINREPVKTADALTEHVRVLWLTPAMDGLFTGPAGDRRRFLDRLVLAIDPAHGRRVNNFDKAVRNRNRILDEAFNNTAWLDAAERQIAELGIAVAAARQELISLLIAEIEKSTKANIHFPCAVLTMQSHLDEQISTGAALDAEDAYLAGLRNNRQRDRQAGRTLEGPHRADLLVRHLEKDMPARLCSTGEQKALLIGLILAHARLVSRLSSMTPLILLDEVAAHLDEVRRASLFDVLESLNCQAFMTGTDASLFEALGARAQNFQLENGHLLP